MTTRRHLPAALAVALVAALALLAPSVATAASRAVLVSPPDGMTVSSPVEVQVQVTREVIDPAVRRVDVRLSTDGAGSSARTVSLSCISRCDGPQSVWGGRSYDPVAPFGGGPACNGRWYLQVALDGGGYGAPTSVVASAHGSPAGNVRVAIDGRDARLTWQRAPEPDVAVYGIERRGEGGEWRQVGTVDASSSSFVDRDVDEGSYEWRIVTLRPDGRSGGSPASACSDNGADLATTSSVTRGRVTEPKPSPTPTEEPTEDASTEDPTDAPTDTETPSGDATSGGGGGGGDATGSGGTDSGAGDATDEPTPGAGTEEPTETVAAPGGDDDAAEPAPTPEEQVRYYGEGQEVGDLDYGDVTAAADEQAAAGEVEGRWVPGGVSVTTERNLDRITLLRPIAAGMILLTFGFHLRRWQREHDV